MPIAIQYFEEESEAEREGKLKFFYTGPNSSEDDIGGSLRGFLRLPDRTPLVFITNIPEQSKFVCDEDDITSGVVQELVDNYKQGDVNWKKVQEWSLYTTLTKGNKPVRIEYECNNWGVFLQPIYNLIIS